MANQMSITSYPALTTIFTPPAECSSRWTWAGKDSDTYMAYTTYDIISSKTDDVNYSTCQPSQWDPNQRGIGTIYSPGVCYNSFDAFWSGSKTVGSKTINYAVCCSSGFVIDIDRVPYECRGKVTTPFTAFFWGTNTAATSTTLVTLAILWHFPMTVYWEQKDLVALSLTTSSVVIVSPTLSSRLSISSPTPSTFVSSDYLATQTPKITSQIISPPTSIITPTQTTDASVQAPFSLGTGSKVALGLGIPLGLLILAIFVYLGFKLYRRTKKLKRPATVARQKRIDSKYQTQAKDTEYERDEQELGPRSVQPDYGLPPGYEEQLKN